MNSNELSINLFDLCCSISLTNEDVNSIIKKYIPEKYNTKLEMFPSNLIAKAFNFKPSELFEVEDEKEKQNVKIDFSK